MLRQIGELCTARVQEALVLLQSFTSASNKPQRAGSANSGAYYSGADSACGFSAYGLATSVSTQLWAWPSNLCIELLQKLRNQI